jgi:hypothetical protein
MHKIFKEKSTWVGLTSVITGVGLIADINEAPAVAEVISNATPYIVSHNWSGILLVITGALATWYNGRK